MSNPLEVIPVASPAELDRFILLPSKLYAADRHYVPQLVMERRDALSPKKNPYFEHAEAQFFIATKGGRDVGRISAQIDRMTKDPAEGHFGMLAAEDDPAVFAALFAAAEAWLKARGKTRILGPFNLSINEETGLLVDGFDTPPMLLMGHDPAYAGPRVEAQGYVKTKDVFAYLYDIRAEFPKAARRMIDRHKPASLRVRTLDTKRYKEEFDTVTEIFNDAWSQNWGFIPFTKAEIAHMAKAMKPLIKPEWVAIVEYEGQAVAFGITLPNLNEMIADFDGKLLPFNWAKLLWRLKHGGKTARVPLMGVRRSFANAGLVAGLAPYLVVDSMRKAVRKDGVEQVELSWILEDNGPMRHMIEALGSSKYKTYRVYEKTLAA